MQIDQTAIEIDQLKKAIEGYRDYLSMSNFVEIECS